MEQPTKSEANTLDLVKANLGITSTVRDDYLQAIVNGVKKEFEDKGVVAVDDDGGYLMLVVDYASWQYRSRGEGIMPRNIRYRLNNLITKGVLSNE